MKEAHFLRDVGLPAIGDIDPVVWFGSFWLAGMLLNIAAIGSLIKRVERGGRETVARFLFAFVLDGAGRDARLRTDRLDLARDRGLLGVFFARNMAGPLWDTWLNQQITDSSVRATVLSLTGQSNAVGQAGRRPGARRGRQRLRYPRRARRRRPAIAPALGLFGRAIVHHGREPELEELPAAVVD